MSKQAARQKEAEKTEAKKERIEEVIEEKEPKKKTTKKTVSKKDKVEPILDERVDAQDCKLRRFADLIKEWSEDVEDILDEHHSRIIRLERAVLDKQEPVQAEEPKDLVPDEKNEIKLAFFFTDPETGKAVTEPKEDFWAVKQMVGNNYKPAYCWYTEGKFVRKLNSVELRKYRP